MSSLIQILILTIIEAVIIFNLMMLPLSLIIFAGLILLQIGLIGFFFSPKRSPTLKADFTKITPQFDAVVEAQNNLSATLDNKIDLPTNLAIFSQKLAAYEQVFANPNQEIKDLSCRKWYLSSLLKFKLYSQVATQLSKPQDKVDKNIATQLVAELNSADASQKLQSQLIGLRINALEKSLFRSIFVGFLTWLHFATTKPIEPNK